VSEPTIRMVDLTALHAPVRDEIRARIDEVLSSGTFIGGPVVAQAEREAARIFGRGAAVGVNSGTDALMLALLALGIGPGDEVLVPALTYFATAGAVAAIGARPVIVDVDDRGLLCPDAARRAVDDRVRAAIAVHLFGGAPDPIVLPPELHIPTIDDLAQAAGGRVGQGVLGAVSTYPTKTWGGAGDGGFVIGDDPDLLARVRALGTHGTIAPHHHDRIGQAVGRNSRLDALQAAVLLVHAETLAARLAKRRHNAAFYDANLPAAARPLPRAHDHAVHQYVVRVPDRDRVARSLSEVGIETAIYYPRPLGAQPALRDRARLTPCPTAEALCASVLALPVHAALEPQDLHRVVAALREVLP